MSMHMFHGLTTPKFDCNTRCIENLLLDLPCNLQYFVISNKSKQLNSISLREVENRFRNTPFPRLSRKDKLTKWLSSFPCCNWTSLFGWYSQWSVTWIEATVCYSGYCCSWIYFGRFTDLGPHKGWWWQRQNCNSLNKNNNNKMNCWARQKRENKNTNTNTNKQIKQ